MNPLFGGTLLTLVEGVGDYALKKYAMGSSASFLSLGVSVYIALSFVLVWLFQHTGFAILNASWDALSNIFTMALGYLVFKESYSLREWLGMGLVTIGLVFINGGHPGKP